MTPREFATRLMRVKGLTLRDPWGTVCRFDRVDVAAKTVWVWYDGLPVPFERDFYALLDAQNGVFRADRDRQFVKVLEHGGGPVIEFEYEFVSK